MAFHNPMDCCETDTSAGKLRRRVEAPERRKECVYIGHIETNPVITDEIRRSAFPLFNTELNSGFGHRRRELPGVSEQVLEHHLKKAAIRVGHYTFRDTNLHSTVGGCPPQLVHHGARQGGKIDVAALQFCAPDPGELQ